MIGQQEIKPGAQSTPFPKEELRFILENLGALAEEVDQTEDERAKAELIKAMSILTWRLNDIMNSSLVFRMK